MISKIKIFIIIFIILLIITGIILIILTSMKKIDILNFTMTDNKLTFYDIFTGANKRITLETTIDNKKYYLVNMDNSGLDKKFCKGVELVLMDKDLLEIDFNKYKKKSTLYEDICKVVNKMTCESSDIIDKNTCNKDYSNCIQKKFYIHEFNFIEVPLNPDNIDLDKKYTIKGNYLPMLNNTSSVSLINQNDFMDNKIKYLCADNIDITKNNLSNSYNFYVEEIITNNIMTIKLKMKNNLGVFVYLGVSEDKLDTVGKFRRLTLYEDPKNINILLFEPNLSL